MSAQDTAKKFASLLKKLRSAYPQAIAPMPEPTVEEGADPVLDQFVFSMLLWETSASQAKAAMRKMREAFVDFNELRVCLADEIVKVMGDRMPLSQERAHRLHASLMCIFQRQHACELLSLKDAGKRESRAFLESLDGTPSFVASRVTLLALGGHAIPCDERLRDLLAQAGIIELTTTPDEASGWLDRHVPAEDGLATHALLQAWSDDEGHAPRRDRRPAAEESEPERPAVRPPKAKPTPRKAGKTKARGGS